MVRRRDLARDVRSDERQREREADLHTDRGQAQDLSWLAGLNDLVTRAVSGPSDVAMPRTLQHDSRRGDAGVLAEVVQLVGLA
jgi:hypothetical protein